MYDSVTLEDGKYEVRAYHDGNLVAYRYGGEWRNLTGDNLVYCLMMKVLRLQAGEKRALKVLKSITEVAAEYVRQELSDGAICMDNEVSALHYAEQLLKEYEARSQP